jgi:hypothetical protein
MISKAQDWLELFRKEYQPPKVICYTQSEHKKLAPGDLRAISDVHSYHPLLRLALVVS